MSSPIMKGTDRFRLSSAPKRLSAGHNRRNHTKSRRGCGACKASRVKCDEDRPQCGRCVWRRKSCTYEEAASVNSVSSQTQEWPASSLYSVFGNTPSFGHIYDPTSASPHMKMRMTSSTQIMQNFSSCVDASFASSTGRSLVKDFILPSCASCPMLMHILLALSARHLQALQPSSSSHKIAHTFHLQASVKQFNKLLKEEVIDAQNIALVYATCLITTMVSYTTNDDPTSNSWIFLEDEASIRESLVWFMIQEGMGLISGILDRHINQTFWRLKRQFGEEQTHTLSFGFEENTSDIECQLWLIYGTAPGTSPDNDPYLIPLCMVNRFLRQDKAGSCELDDLLSFGPKVPSIYRRHIQEKDDKALLLLMLWLILLGRKAPWWAATRVQNELAAVMWFLSQSQDERIKRIALNTQITMK
ncbi:unnamed protein product [Penicillium salamii]|nr:unnamed protein product [Penicillium salamii]